MKRKPIRSFKRFIAGTLAFVTAFSIVSGYPLSVSAEERVPTGTDLDNFDISLNWGDKSEGLSDAYELHMDKEGTATVKMQLTVEYTGDGTETYQPEELSISLGDFYDIVPKSVTMSFDIGAELKGSGSGRGDWYYTKVYNSSTKKNDFVLTNKNIINTAFTSTVQIVFNIPASFHNWTPNSEAQVSAQFSNGDSILNSNILSIKYTGKRDVNKLQCIVNKKISSSGNLLKMIDKSKWADYWYGELLISATSSEANTIGLKSGNKLVIKLPEDIIFDYDRTNGVFIQSDVNKYEFIGKSSSSTGHVGSLRLYIAIPKAQYLNKNSFDFKAIWSGTYSDSNEVELIDTLEKTYEVSYFDYDYIENLLNNIYTYSINDNHSYYQEVMEYGYENKNSLVSNSYVQSANNSYNYYIGESTYNIIVGIDKNYFIYTDGSYREAEDDEVSFTSIPILAKSDYELYGRPEGADEYELIVSGNETKSKSIDISSGNKQYSDVYIKYKNISTTFSLTRDYWNSKVSSNKNLNSNKKMSKVITFGYMQIENIDENSNISNIEFNNSYKTNIKGLDEELASLDKAEGNTKKRNSVIKEVKEVNYEADSGFKSKDIPSSEIIKDNSVLMGVANYYMNSSSIGGINVKNPSLSLYNMVSYEATFSYANTLNIDIDNLKYCYNGAASTCYSKEELEEKELWKVVSLSNSQEGDTNKLYVKFEYLGDESLNSKVESLPIPKFDFYTSLDDYYMMNLGGKSTKFEVNAKINIYSEITNLNYELETSDICSLSYPDIANNTYQGIETEVSTDAKPDYTKEKTKVNLDGTYSYKLKASAGETQMANIVLYDNIENVEDSAWRGTFDGVSLNKLQQAGVDISKFKIYYSTDRNQTCSLDSDGWISSSDYTGILSDVKSVAIDMQDYVLGTKQRMYVEILMKAPKDGALGSTTLNQYNASYQEFDDGDINLTTPLKTTTNLPSNTTEVALGDVMTNISVVKIWDDSNDRLNYRPDSITGKILQNGVVYDTFELSKDNKWTAQITARMYDDKDAIYEYTVVEDSVDNYIPKITKTADELNNYSFTVTNSLSPDLYTEITGTKSWDDNDDEYGIRPDSITVNLYQNDVKIDSTMTDSSKEWKYTFGIFDKCDSEGNEYAYTVKEEVVDGYTTEYINYFDIINHLVRYQDLNITKLIPLSDILAEHGTPSFIFKAEGSNGHTYYQTITFDENSDYGIYEENGIKYAILSTTFFDIEEDIYTVSEIGVSRFKLQGITDISDNATVSGDTVVVDLTQGYGYATFINAKTKWNNFSHNDIKVNEIDLEPKKPV